MGLEMDRRQRALVGALLPTLFVGLTAVPYLVVAGDLPSPIAVHFDGRGSADGAAHVWLHLLVVAAFTLPAAAVLMWAAWRPTSTLGAEAAVATFLGFLLGGLNLIVLLANEGAGRWQDVDLGGLGGVWGMTIGALGASLPVARLVHRNGSDRPTEPGPALPLEASERAAWFGGASSRVVAGSVVFLVFIGTMVLLAAGSGALATALVLLASGLVMMSFMSVAVAVGERGVHVRAGALRWPRMHFSLDEIEAARCVDWHPTKEGLVSGWGYRGSLRLMRRAGWVLRGGPALELDLTGDRRFVVTVDGADEAAAVLNGLLHRRPAPTPSG
jgi:hypothetical protein